MLYWNYYNINDLAEENWVDCKNFEEMYCISNYARLKRKYKEYDGGIGHGWRILNPKIITQHIHKSGYIQASFTINGTPWVRKIHRIVAEAFIPNPNNYPHINHKDGNKLNNLPSNLEWCNQKQNMKHALVSGLLNKQKINIYKRFPKPILQFDLNNNLLKEWDSIQKASSVMSINAIRFCLYNQTKKPKQFIWKFK